MKNQTSKKHEVIIDGVKYAPEKKKPCGKKFVEGNCEKDCGWYGIKPHCTRDIDVCTKGL
jgi:hypothetical protein